MLDLDDNAVRDSVLPEIYDRQKHPFMSPPAREIDDPLAVFCQDTLRSTAIEDQPFFDPSHIHTLMDKVAGMSPDERAAFEGVVLRVVSTVLMQLELSGVIDPDLARSPVEPQPDPLKRC